MWLPHLVEDKLDCLTFLCPNFNFLCSCLKVLKQFTSAWPCKYLSSWSCNFVNMSAINPGETQETTWGSKEFCHESFSPGVHLKISTLGNQLFCAWCPHIKNNHMKILNLFTKLMKQSFSINDHQIIPQNCSTVLNFQKQFKSTTFQGKNWRKIC